MKRIGRIFSSISLIALISILGLLFFSIYFQLNNNFDSSFTRTVPRQDYLPLNHKVWIINTFTNHNQTVKFVNEDILIEDNGILTIDWNGTIMMNSTTEYEFNITIKDNGKLILNNGSLLNNNKTKIYLRDNASIVALNHSSIALSVINSSQNSSLIFNETLVLLEGMNIYGLDFHFNHSILNVTFNGSSNTNSLINVQEKMIFYNSSIFSLGNTVGTNGLNSNLTLVSYNNLTIIQSDFIVLGGAGDTGGPPAGGNSNVYFYSDYIYLEDFTLISTGKKILGKGTSSVIQFNSTRDLVIKYSSINALALAATNAQYSGNSLVFLNTKNANLTSTSIHVKGGDSATIQSATGKANLTMISKNNLIFNDVNLSIIGGNGLTAFDPSDGGNSTLILRANDLYFNSSFINCTPGLRDLITSQNGNLTFEINGSIRIQNMENSDILINNSIDFDFDGLCNLIELNESLTDPTLLDTDGDLLNDSAEYEYYKTNPLDTDTDGDKLNDYEEIMQYHTNPLIIDTDFDRINDYNEVKVYHTNPSSPDSDYDGLWDYDEIFLFHTNPNDMDTDNDGLIDSIDFFKLLPIDIPILILLVAASTTGIVIRNRRIKSKKKTFQSNIKEFKSSMNNYILIFNKQLGNLKELFDNLIEISENFYFESYKERDIIEEYKNFKSFIGIGEIIEDLNIILSKMDGYLEDLKKKYRNVGFEQDFREDFVSLAKNKIKKINKIAEFLNKLRKTFLNAHHLGVKGKIDNEKNPYTISKFDKQFDKFVMFFENKHKEIKDNIENWLSRNLLSKINEEIKKLELSFSEIEIWFQEASNWAIKLRIPKGYGYHLQLSEKWSIYAAKRDEYKAKIYAIKEILDKSISLTRDFISWNIVLINDNKIKLNKDIRKKIFIKLKNSDVEDLNIDPIIKMDIENLRSVSLNENKKMSDFFKSHDSYPIEDLIVEWHDNYNEFISILDEIKDEIKENYKYLALFIKINRALFKQIKQNINFLIIKYENYVLKYRDIEGYQNINKYITEKSLRINKKIEKFEKYYINLCNNLPFKLSDISISFFIFDWEDQKEIIMKSYHKLISLKFQFKCDILQEYLDPYKSEIWECSNCGAISCNEHLEKWFLKKGTPQCFKCGKVGSFSKKIIEGLPLISKPKKTIKREWIELLSCKTCGKVLKVLSFKLLNNKDLEIKTSCEDHLDIKKLILPNNLSSEWMNLVESNMSDEIKPLFLKIKENFYREDE